MNRITYWLTANTIYNIQSPSLYRLCGEVLCARLPHALRRRLPRRHRKYHEALYKLSAHLGARAVPMGGAGDGMRGSLLALRDGRRVAVVCAPHASASAARHWGQLRQEREWRVSIDLYDVGVLLDDPRLSRQHIVLKGWGW